MSEINSATEILLADISGSEYVPIREDAASGLLRISLSRFKAWLLTTVFAGGTTGQVLTKNSGTDFDFDWADPSGGGGGISDAPSDSILYGRKDADWVPVPGAGGLTKLDQVVVGSAVGSITFASISDAYEDLIIVGEGQLSGSADFIWASLNGDTATNYQWVRGVFQGTTPLSTSGTSPGLAVGLLDGTGGTYAGIFECLIPGYARSVWRKRAIARSSIRIGTGANQILAESESSEWSNNAAITDIVLTPNAGNFAVGTVVTLYGRG